MFPYRVPSSLAVPLAPPDATALLLSPRQADRSTLGAQLLRGFRSYVLTVRARQTRARAREATIPPIPSPRASPTDRRGTRSPPFASLADAYQFLTPLALLKPACRRHGLRGWFQAPRCPRLRMRNSGSSHRVRARLRRAGQSTRARTLIPPARRLLRPCRRRVYGIGGPTAHRSLRHGAPRRRLAPARARAPPGLCAGIAGAAHAGAAGFVLTWPNWARQQVPQQALLRVPSTTKPTHSRHLLPGSGDDVDVTMTHQTARRSPSGLTYSPFTHGPARGGAGAD